jgi:aldehyde dehydrogenase (NAD+)/betaine-aldehyde dehydrogenase
VITGLPNSARSNQEEIFGPVCSIQPFADDAEAAFLANDSRYGLAATIYTKDFGRAHRLAREIRAGTVSINTPFTAMPGIPFGGFKESGYGREQAMHSMGLYSESKSIIAYIGTKPFLLWSG